ncbi:MAG: DegT/DnrJ/EryC1/StrS family aminotransferase, partial [Thermoanaerobaculia bacterium]
MAIPFIDLKGQYERLKPQIQERINRVLEHGQYIMGPEVGELEERLAAFVGVKHCITVASGTDALLVPLMAWGIGPGDEVITSPFSFIATAEVIVLLGAKPVFVDIDPRTYNIDPSLIEERITPRTKAIIPMSIFGQPADMTRIVEIGKRHSIRVLEDACQSFGATHHGRRSGSFPDCGATSFFPSKPLGCYGDGGAIFTDDDELALASRQIRANGQRKRYDHARIGINARFDTIQAAVLLAKCEVLEEELGRRLAAAARYDRLLGSTPGVVVPHIDEGNRSAYAQYSVRIPLRGSVISKLAAREIPTAIHYPKPIHLQDPFLGTGAETGAFPVSEEVAATILSLPFDPWMSPEQQQYISAAFAEAV